MKKGDDRRQLLIDTAERLFYSRGYEQTSIQDILDALHFSKGGFYHHFESKFALMEAICAQRAQQSCEAARAAVEACTGDATEKLNAFFEKSGIWQSDSTDYVGLLIRVAYREDGALMREKMKQRQIELTLPVIERIIVQGVREGVFFVPRGDGVAELVLRLGMQLTDEIAYVLASGREEQDAMAAIVDKLNLYRYAIERLLGAPFGSIVLLRVENLAQIMRAVPAATSRTGEAKAE